MKKYGIVFMLLVIMASSVVGQCSALFSFSAYFNRVTFFNQSNISNAHYFWNFGDGTGSNFGNPIHTFPGNGEYYVTLFAEDTVSKCSAYYNYRVNVKKYSHDSCQPEISDSIGLLLGDTSLFIYNISPNCNNLQVIVTGGDGANFSEDAPILMSTAPYRMVCIGQYYDNDWRCLDAAYKSALYKYSSSKNYGNCSANYEFIAISKNHIGERILFSAMDKNAAYYSWQIAGFGDPITSTNDTISQFFPYSSPDTWIVALATEDSDGCRDTLYQNIAISDSINTIPGKHGLAQAQINIEVYPNPSNGQFTLQWSGVSGLKAVDVYNELGQQVSTLTLPSPSGEGVSGSFQLNLSSQPNGIYFYRIISIDGSLVGDGKMVIQK